MDLKDLHNCNTKSEKDNQKIRKKQTTCGYLITLSWALKEETNCLNQNKYW